MTDFRDSGLPNNPTVFKAFTTYRQNMEGMPAPIRAADAPLKVAQVISQNSDHNNPKNPEEMDILRNHAGLHKIRATALLLLLEMWYGGIKE